MAKLAQFELSNSFRELGDAFYTLVESQPLLKPYLVHGNDQVAGLLGLDTEEFNNPDFVKYINGDKPHPGFSPLAMVYSGHQFGTYNPRLGDGRGLLLGEAKNEKGHWDVHLKGAGLTPYSRGGDGRAVLRSTIREYLCSQATKGLGIPTTLALCIIGSEEKVYRELVEPGASLVRVAESHVRFGSFEYFFYTQQHEALKTLADYVIDRHFTEFKSSPDKYLEFFCQVVIRTAKLFAQWQAQGFTHGVLNTDNMSILGDTFDYGPFAFLDVYQSGFVPNHSDYTGRYAFDQQSAIGLWNCGALAHALSPLISEEGLKEGLASYKTTFAQHYHHLMCNKLGITHSLEKQQALVMELLALMKQDVVDYTLFFRELCSYVPQKASTTQTRQVRDLFVDRVAFDRWSADYAGVLAQETCSDQFRKEIMLRTNPKYILRNYLAQIAIEKAQNEKDFSEIRNLITLLQAPYDEHEPLSRYAALPPAWSKELEISCSS